MPSRSRARLAGAASVAKNPARGLRACSQSGHTGQVRVLRNGCPLAQVVMGIDRVALHFLLGSNETPQQGYQI